MLKTIVVATSVTAATIAGRKTKTWPNTSSLLTKYSPAMPPLISSPESTRLHHYYGELPRAVHAAHQDLFDIGGAAGTRDQYHRTRLGGGVREN